jgi:Metal-dependent amidase/aminoacylase/carboxypeptidase
VKIMQSHGFEVEHPYSGIETAFNAVKKNGSGPVIAFLAEYDALPEIGHACGHNMNGIISALGAVGLAEAWAISRGKCVL